MATAEWDVEDALREVVNTIDEGAVGLSVNDDTRHGLMDLYRPDFTARREAGADWNTEKKDVLPLCFLIGGSAELLTIAGSGGDPSLLLRGELDEPTVYAMAVLVARLHCRPKSGDIEILRKWCALVGSGKTKPKRPLPALTAEILSRLDELKRKKRAPGKRPWS